MQSGRGDYKASLKFFRQAVSKDPNYARAYAAMATSYFFLGFLALMAPGEAFPKSEEFARRAIELDDLVPEAHMALALVYFNNWKFEAAESEFRRGIELAPNLSSVRVIYSQFLSILGRFGEAVAEIRRSLKLDPLSAGPEPTLGPCFSTQECTTRRSNSSNALEINPGANRNNLGLAYVRKGRVDEGIRELEQALRSRSDSAPGDLVYAYAKARRMDDARRVLGKLLRLQKARSGFALAIAGAYSNVGETEKALGWLEKAYEERSGGLATVGIDLVFDNIRMSQDFGRNEEDWHHLGLRIVADACAKNVTSAQATDYVPG